MFHLMLTWVPPANGDAPPWGDDGEPGANHYSSLCQGDAPSIGETLMMNFGRGPLVDLHVTAVERQVVDGPGVSLSMGEVVIVRACNQRPDA